MQFIVDKLGSMNTSSWSSRIFSIKNISSNNNSNSSINNSNDSSNTNNNRNANPLYGSYGGDAHEQAQPDLCLYISQKKKPDQTHHHCLLPRKVEVYPHYDAGYIYSHGTCSKEELRHIICITGTEVKRVDESESSQSTTSSGSDTQQRYRSSGLLQERRRGRGEKRWFIRFANMEELRVAVHLISSRLPTSGDKI